MIWLELLVFLTCILVGIRLRGIGLGTVAGIGLAIFVFFFGLPPGSPPGTVIGMILAVITALSALQAAGGIDYVVKLAERAMRRRPQSITFVAPVATYLLVIVSGTTHVIYALLPIIAEVARLANIRPERPLSISVVAAFQGVRASPIAASTVAMLGFLGPLGVSLPGLLAIIIPSTFLSVLVGALSVAWRGKDLKEDPEYLARLASGALKPPEPPVPLTGKELRNARGATLLLLGAVLLVVLLGVFPGLRPFYGVNPADPTDTEQVGTGSAIMIIMIAAAGLTMTFFKASPKKAVKGNMMRSGITAIISIIGVSWLGSSFFEGNRQVIVSGVAEVVRLFPWAFAAGLFLLSSMLYSAAAAVVVLVPIGVALRMTPAMLIAFYPAACGNFFLPTYGTLLAAVAFDQTGSTRIGKYLFNHSFMRPGLVTAASAVLFALLLSRVVPLG
jgi:anaerobic C4-dicarboxylate transporter DcuA